MQLLPSRFFRRSILLYAVAVLAVGSLLGACDRHSAEELPESYGHGSAHKRAFDRHQPDSRQHSDHFSDSQGVNPGGEGEAKAGPTATPGATASGQMFPQNR